ncbi:MAG: hypothetical protein Q4E13_13050 [Clostridia bacterium]|nr:hypothetical protein [Clostridia bacterium]
MNNTAVQTISLSGGTPTAVALPITTPNKSITYTPVNRMTIAMGGDYEIHYFLSGTLDQNAVMTLAIRKNVGGIPSAIASRAVLANQAFTLSGNTYVNLQPGDVIDMTIASSRAAKLKLNSGVNASLTLKKLD